MVKTVPSTSPGATQASKPRNKAKDDIPFPVVYFGFILAFLALKGQEMYDTMPAYLPDRFLPEMKAMYVPLGAFFIACPLLGIWRTFLKWAVFSPLAKNWAGLQPGSGKFEKFIEQAWLAVHYFIVTSLGYVVLRSKPWWPPIISESANKALSPTQFEREQDQLDIGMQVLYAVQLGFYTLELITLLSSKHRRSDAVMYFFHHIFTIFLMAGSWAAYNHRIGSLVLFCHDIGDIFLPIGKCFTYAEEHIRLTKTSSEYGRHKVVGMFFFVLFVINFAIPRLIVFGALIYKGVFDFAWYQCCGLDVATGFCGRCTMASVWNKSLTATLGLLYPMHVYWFYLIVKMATRLLCAPGEYDDVRSGSEKED